MYVLLSHVPAYGKRKVVCIYAILPPCTAILATFFFCVARRLLACRCSDMEAYVVSYRDTREKGGKVVYNLLLLGLGVTLPYLEAGLTMKLGDLVVVRVRCVP